MSVERNSSPLGLGRIYPPSIPRMYGKLFASMFDGSLVSSGSWQALVTFQQLIILCDAEGEVDMHPSAISRRTGIPLEIIEEGIRVLEAPDPQSRTPDEEGRRIVLLDPNRSWGWRIVNHKHYRAMRTAEERREYHRKYWQDKRSPKSSTSPQQHSTDSTELTNCSTQEAVCSTQHTNTPSTTPPSPTSAPKARKARASRSKNECPDWLKPIEQAHEIAYGVGTFKPFRRKFIEADWEDAIASQGLEKCLRTWLYVRREDNPRLQYMWPNYVLANLSSLDPRQLAWDEVSPEALQKHYDDRAERLAAAGFSDGTRPAVPDLSKIRAVHERIYTPGSFTKELRQQFAESWERLLIEHGADHCARVWAYANRGDSPEAVEARAKITPAYVAKRFRDFTPGKHWSPPWERAA